jgi:hypothetical protein
MYPFQNRLEEEHQDASPGPNLKLVGTISPEQLERKVMPVRTSSGIEKLLAA